MIHNASDNRIPELDISLKCVIKEYTIFFYLTDPNLLFQPIHENKIKLKILISDGKWVHKYQKCQYVQQQNKFISLLTFPI